MLFRARTSRPRPYQLITLVVSTLLLGSTNVAWGQSPTRPQSDQPATGNRQRQMTAQEIQAYQDAQATLQSPRQPPGFPLQPSEQQYVEQLLDYWQRVSDKINQYKCDFQRYEYDTGLVNLRDPKTNQLYAAQQAAGRIRYASPGKARFETAQLFKFAGAPKFDGGPADYQPLEGHKMWGRAIHECWVCTGDAVYEFDFEAKRSYEQKIPPNMQGNVVESPLPFLFGAKKDDILRRYWVRYVPKYSTQPNGEQVLIEDEYWLDVFPKRIEDARLYSKIELVLSADDFMPLSIHRYAANYDPKKNNYSSQYFLFQNRKVNGRWEGISDWTGNFIKPNLPFGWKTVQYDLGNPKSADAAGQFGVKPR